jgi:hypothetical protein
MSNIRTSNPLILHPFLIGSYAVIALLAHNIEEIEAAVALRALVIVLALAALAYLAAKAILKDRLKAGLLTTLALALFFTYGHVYNDLEPVSLLGFSLGRHRLLAPLWLVLYAGLATWVYRTRSPLLNLNRLLNLVAAATLILPLAQLGMFTIRSISATSGAKNPVSGGVLRLPEQNPPPDVYYFILDAYARDDVLKEEFDLDTTPFLEQLESMGFYIARCSQSNYAQTQLSLSSSLNMDYLQDLEPDYTPEQTSRVGMEELIRHSAVRKAFEGLGYQIVAFETGFKGTQWEDADLYIGPNSGLLQSMQIAGGPNGFEVMLMRTSGALLLADGAAVLPKFMQPDFDNPRKIHRDLILYNLEQLSNLPAVPGPKLVFTHLVIPHPPYVFGQDGEFTDFDKEYVPGYRDQVIYLNKRLIDLLPRLISGSATPPVIILQGDHGSIGSRPNHRTSIFNAYYLPRGPANLYPAISPVNSFRSIFNRYFGGNYPILQDISYYSVYSAPFDFTIIPNKRDGCGG